MSNWTDPPPKAKPQRDYDEQVMMLALRVLADARLVEIMPHAAGLGSCDLLRERARQLVQEYERG